VNWISGEANGPEVGVVYHLTLGKRSYNSLMLI
jgi:hypothetical protein